jgi:hypothetical protein
LASEGAGVPFETASKIDSRVDGINEMGRENEDGLFH